MVTDVSTVLPRYIHGKEGSSSTYNHLSGSRNWNAIPDEGLTCITDILFGYSWLSRCMAAALVEQSQ